MTRRDPTPADAVLVAIDVAKARNEVLIAPPGARRRRLAVLNTRAEHDRLVEILSGYAAPVVVGFEATGDYHRALAWRLADAGRLQEAQELCQRLRAQNPMEAEAHFLAAVLAEELGDSAAARDALRKVIYLEPAMIAAHVHLRCGCPGWGIRGWGNCDLITPGER